MPPGCEAPDSPYDIDDDGTGARGCSSVIARPAITTISAGGRRNAVGRGTLRGRKAIIYLN